MTAMVAQRMVAPGAEEFLATDDAGPVAPARAHVRAARRPRGCRVPRRARALRRSCSSSTNSTTPTSLGVRRFFQGVDRSAGHAVRRERAGRAAVGRPLLRGERRRASTRTAGAFRLATPPTQAHPRVGRLQHHARALALARRRWLHRRWAPAAIRPENEDIHDVTTSFETEIPETATRVFILYKINIGLHAIEHRPDAPGSRRPLRRAGQPGAAVRARRHAMGGAGRACGTCSAIPTSPASIYDELLVVRPPKRVVGGFLVRF